MRGSVVALLVLVAVVTAPVGAGLARANAPDPAAPCADHEEGDRCILKPYYDGHCKPKAECINDTYDNGCLICDEAAVACTGCAATFGPAHATFWLQGAALLVGLLLLRLGRRRR